MSLSSGDRSVFLIVQKKAVHSEETTDDVDEFGDPIEDSFTQPIEGDWEDHIKLWVDFYPERAQERNDAGTDVPVARYRAEADMLDANGINTTHRAKIEADAASDVDRLFDITGVSPFTGDRKMTRIMLQEQIGTVDFQ